MKTLVPPQITPGKRQFLKIDGDRHLQSEGKTIMCDMQYYPWIDLKDGDWKMFEAAPSMAEALLDFVNAHETCSYTDFNRRMESCRDKAVKALLAAGYTEAADQE